MRLLDIVGNQRFASGFTYWEPKQKASQRITSRECEHRVEAIRLTARGVVEHANPHHSLGRPEVHLPPAVHTSNGQARIYFVEGTSGMWRKEKYPYDLNIFAGVGITSICCWKARMRRTVPTGEKYPALGGTTSLLSATLMEKTSLRLPILTHCPPQKSVSVLRLPMFCGFKGKPIGKPTIMGGVP